MGCENCKGKKEVVPDHNSGEEVISILLMLLSLKEGDLNQWE
jgi:hypothetical protein